MSVPVWGVTLSRPLSVLALVGHYPTNKLMDRRPIPKRRNFHQKAFKPKDVMGY